LVERAGRVRGWEILRLLLMWAAEERVLTCGRVVPKAAKVKVSRVVVTWDPKVEVAALGMEVPRAGESGGDSRCGWKVYDNVQCALRWDATGNECFWRGSRCQCIKREVIRVYNEYIYVFSWVAFVHAVKKE
jgi:hypothetical protein